MKPAIMLSFGENGEVDTGLPGREKINCLAGECKFARFVPQPEGFDQLVCGYNDRPVFDIYADERRCPQNKWYRANHPEGAPVQYTLKGW